MQRSLKDQQEVKGRLRGAELTIAHNDVVHYAASVFKRIREHS